MDAPFTAISFAQPDSAEITLAGIAITLPSDLFRRLPALLAQLPDPDSSLNYLERYLRAEAPDGTPRNIEPVLRFLSQNPRALLHLLTIFSYSRYLSDMLLHQPELILWLDRPASVRAATIDRMKRPEDLHEEYARFAATAFDLPPALVLARFKRREYLRITLRDVLGIATLADTTLELSQLTDVLLDTALRICEQKLEHDYGTPQSADSSGKLLNSRLAILSLGKLGGQELNYSSDIDLMFVYGSDGATTGGRLGSTTNSEFFVRLAQSVSKLLTEMTTEGALYRVDLRLRPQGREGVLATSVEAALAYYRGAAREWELQMLVKARCSAGDIAIGNRFVKEVQPLVYRPEFNLVALGAVVRAREEITRELRRNSVSGDHTAVWNVKLTPGGIRDIEFITQCLQRLYGGVEPWIRSGTTLVAMQRLHDKAHLSSSDFNRLSSAYQFFRRVEHRLQLRDGLQRHTLPRSPDSIERLARRCGVERAIPSGPTAGEQFLERLRQHFEEVREIYERLLAAETQPESPAPSLESESEAGPGALLRRLGADWPIVAHAYDEIAHGGDAHARRGLLNYLTSAMFDSALMDDLAENPGWLSRAAELFSASDFVGEWLVREPQLIRLVTHEQRGATHQPVQQQSIFPRDMNSVRHDYRRDVFLAVVNAVDNPASPFETFSRFTELADRAIRETLDFALREIAAETPATASFREISRDLGSGPLVVIALGRLGSHEMDIGSDADVIFVTADLASEEREPWRRVVERFVQFASSQTRDGMLFPVDTRLRPRGSEGEIVQTTSYILDYYQRDAGAWEAASFLKARAVAGNIELGNKLIHKIHKICATRFSDATSLRAELAAMRERLVNESSVWEAGRPPEREFKKVAGGFYDVDYIVALQFLSHGLRAGISSSGNILQQIASLKRVAHSNLECPFQSPNELRAFRAFLSRRGSRDSLDHRAKCEARP